MTRRRAKVLDLRPGWTPAAIEDLGHASDVSIARRLGMKIDERGAVHCADETFEPGTWTLCGRRRAEVATRSPAEFDAYGRDFQCDVCGAQRRLIVAHTPTNPPT